MGGACTLFLVPPAGVLGSVSGVEEARSLDGVVDVRIYREPGSVLSPLRRGADRAGAVIAVGDSRDAGAGAGSPCGRSRTLRDGRCSQLTSRKVGFQPPAVGEEEIAAVAETIRSGWLTTGPKAAELEERFEDYLGAKHAIAVTSGTAAMHLALLALGVGPGDEVITSPITWPATANVVVHCGATVVFADVREGDLNIDPEHVRELVTPRTKAILPVHLAGQPGRPRPAARARAAGGRGRGPCGRDASTAAARSARSRT